MNKEKISVLLAEDDRNLGNLLREYLEAKGYESKLATNGKEAFDFFNKASHETWIVTLPWNLGRMHISDFGITGNVTLLVVLTWLLFALRRENHSIKNLIDFHEAYQPDVLSYRDPLIVLATQPVLAAEHYAYAYYAVSQRFMGTSKNRSGRVSANLTP